MRGRPVHTGECCTRFRPSTYGGSPPPGALGTVPFGLAALDRLRDHVDASSHGGHNTEVDELVKFILKYINRLRNKFSIRILKRLADTNIHKKVLLTTYIGYRESLHHIAARVDELLVQHSHHFRSLKYDFWYEAAELKEASSLNLPDVPLRHHHRSAVLQTLQQTCGSPEVSV